MAFMCQVTYGLIGTVLNVCLDKAELRVINSMVDDHNTTHVFFGKMYQFFITVPRGKNDDAIHTLRFQRFEDDLLFFCTVLVAAKQHIMMTRPCSKLDGLSNFRVERVANVRDNQAN